MKDVEEIRKKQVFTKQSKHFFFAKKKYLY